MEQGNRSSQYRIIESIFGAIKEKKVYTIGNLEEDTKINRVTIKRYLLLIELIQHMPPIVLRKDRRPIIVTLGTVANPQQTFETTDKMTNSDAVPGIQSGGSRFQPSPAKVYLKSFIESFKKELAPWITTFSQTRLELAVEPIISQFSHHLSVKKKGSPIHPLIQKVAQGLFDCPSTLSSDVLGAIQSALTECWDEYRP
jgi:hypothetical protein